MIFNFLHILCNRDAENIVSKIDNYVELSEEPNEEYDEMLKVLLMKKFFKKICLSSVA